VSALAAPFTVVLLWVALIPISAFGLESVSDDSSDTDGLCWQYDGGWIYKSWPAIDTLCGSIGSLGKSFWHPFYTAMRKTGHEGKQPHND